MIAHPLARRSSRVLFRIRWRRWQRPPTSSTAAIPSAALVPAPASTHKRPIHRRCGRLRRQPSTFREPTQPFAQPPPVRPTVVSPPLVPATIPWRVPVPTMVIPLRAAIPRGRVALPVPTTAATTAVLPTPVVVTPMVRWSLHPVRLRRRQLPVARGRRRVRKRLDAVRVERKVVKVRYLAASRQ